MLRTIFLPLCLLGCAFALTFNGLEVDRPDLVQLADDEAVKELISAKQTQNCQCGQRKRTARSQSEEERIVGGVQAQKNEFPWRVALFLDRGNGRMSYFCTGTVLDNTWILTAAHCAKAANDNNYDIIADMGDHDINSTSETPNQYRDVAQIIIHPQYNQGQSYNNDIALLRLQSAITTASNVMSICLPYKFRNSDFNGTNVVASGWGATQQGNNATPNILRRVHLKVLTTAQCQRYLGTRVNDNMLCTYLEGKDTCQGDSGGSIDYKDPSSGQYMAIGIVSWGYGCAQKNAPGVYTKVTRYLDWIQQTTGRSFCSS